MKIWNKLKKALSREDPYKDEKWVELKATKGEYHVSNLGRVKSMKKRVNGEVVERILNPADAKNRLLVRMSTKGKLKTLKLHRLVAHAFVPNPDNLPDVGFIDHNYKNCNYKNLYWKERNEKHPEHSKRQFRRTAGEKNGQHKLKDKDAQSVYDEAWKGFMTQYEIAQRFKISGGYVSEIKNRKKRKHLHDGK